MTTRRSFLSRLLATLPALLLPRIVSAGVPRSVSAAPGIPRQMDIRMVLHPLAFDIEVSRHGEKLWRAVAYDLDADTVTVIGGVDTQRGCFTYRTLHGGVSVTWIQQ